MRVIKFRGRDVHTGEYVFGFYTTGSDDKSFIIITSTQGQYLREVKPDSVAQLVGYDANGNEIYEGDTLIDPHGAEYTALNQAMVYWKEFDKIREVADIPKESRTIPLVFSSRFTPLTLKEDDQ